MRRKWIWIVAAIVVFLGIGAVKSNQDKKAAAVETRAMVVETAAPTATPEPTPKATATPEPELVAIEAAPVATETPVTRSAEKTYIINTSSGEFHKPTCSSVDEMAEYNKREFTGTREDVIAMGYVPCKRCNP